VADSYDHGNYLSVPSKTRNFLSSSATISFSASTKFSGIISATVRFSVGSNSVELASVASVSED
jgi:hypothetical protein